MQTTQRPCVLWVDLRLSDKKTGGCGCPHVPWELHRCTDIRAIENKITRLLPRLVCFDFGYPDISGLIALEQTIQCHPQLPVVLVTEKHCEELAVWALRSGVRDYLIKPVTKKDIDACAKRLSKQDGFCSHNPIPRELKFWAPQVNKVHLAKSFVEGHYHERIRVSTIAEFCGMSVAAFSRHFKQEYGTTFREYLMQYRIKKAKEMLHNPNPSVADVVYSVGFNDPSYFTRVFRRRTGLCPTCYRDGRCFKTGQRRGNFDVCNEYTEGAGVI